MLCPSWTFNAQFLFELPWGGVLWIEHVPAFSTFTTSEMKLKQVLLQRAIYATWGWRVSAFAGKILAGSVIEEACVLNLKMFGKLCICICLKRCKQGSHAFDILCDCSMHWTSTCRRGNTFEHESDPTCYARRSPNASSRTIKIIMKAKQWLSVHMDFLGWELEAGGIWFFCDAVHSPGLNKMVIYSL